MWILPVVRWFLGGKFVWSVSRQREAVCVKTRDKCTRKRRCPSSKDTEKEMKNNWKTRVHPTMLHYLRCCCVVSSPGRNIKTQKTRTKKKNLEGKAARTSWLCRVGCAFFFIHTKCVSESGVRNWLRCTYATRNQVRSEMFWIYLRKIVRLMFYLLFFCGSYSKLKRAAYSSHSPSWEKKSNLQFCVNRTQALLLVAERRKKKSILLIAFDYSGLLLFCFKNEA